MTTLKIRDVFFTHTWNFSCSKLPDTSLPIPVHLQEESGSSPWLPSLLKDYLASQCLSLHHVLQTCDHLGGSLLNLLRYVNVSLALVSPRLDAELQMGFHKC